MKTLLTLLFICVAYPAFAQQKFTPIGELSVNQRKEQRAAVVLISTPWCKLCHALKNTLLRNDKISELVRSDYFLVDFNAEQQGEIEFSGSTYRFINSGKNAGFHGLATKWASMDGEIVFPTLIILNSNGEIIFRHVGFLNPEQILNILSACKDLNL